MPGMSTNERLKRVFASAFPPEPRTVATFLPGAKQGGDHPRRKGPVDERPPDSGAEEPGRAARLHHQAVIAEKVMAVGDPPRQGIAAQDDDGSHEQREM